MNATEKLSKAISAAEEELREIDSVIDSLEVETRTALSRITADYLSGEIDDAKAAKLREQAERELDRTRDRRETLQAGIPELRARLAAEQEAARLVKVGNLRAEAEKQAANLNRAVKEFSNRTRETASAAREVQRHRDLVDATVAVLQPHLADSEDHGVDVDEIGWPETASELGEFLAAGSRRPQAERNRQAEKAAAAAEQQAIVQLNWLRLHANEMCLQTLPAHLQERGRAVLAECQAANETQQKRLREQAKSREAERI